MATSAILFDIASTPTGSNDIHVSACTSADNVKSTTPASGISATASKKLGLISPARVMVVGDAPGDHSPFRR